MWFDKVKGLTASISLIKSSEESKLLFSGFLTKRAIIDK
jgi:hypothetical protein